MGYRNVILKGAGFYHPAHKVLNDEIIQYFDSIGKEVQGLMRHLCREERFFACEGENTLTMALESSKEAIQKAGISVDDLDMIVFVSEMPEYLIPTCALKLNNFLGAKNAHILMDLNQNCTGMISGLDFVSRYMQSNKKIKYTLLVGAILNTGMIRPDCTITHSGSADASVAIILEAFEGEKLTGFLDSAYYTDSSYHNSITFPGCGFSNIHNTEIEIFDKKLIWNPFDFSFLANGWAILIKEVTESKGYTVKDIDHFLFSQFSKPDVLNTLACLGITDIDNKMTFIGDKYGYTGCTSPFVALYDAIEKGKVSEGSLVIFISVAAGYSMSAVLMRL